MGVSALAVSAHAQLQNGSFENLSGFTDNSGNDTTVLNPGDTSMTGWTVVNDPLAWIGPSNPFNLFAPDGSYYLDLTSYSDYPPYGGVAQTVTTLAGHNYVLSFDLGTEGFLSAPAISASATGTAAATYVNTSIINNDWQTFDYDFTATGSSTLITLTGATTGYTTFIGLDDVNLTDEGPSSAPDASSSFGLLSVGLAGLAGLRRKLR